MAKHRLIDRLALPTAPGVSDLERSMSHAAVVNHTPATFPGKHDYDTIADLYYVPSVIYSKTNGEFLRWNQKEAKFKPL